MDAPANQSDPRLADPEALDTRHRAVLIRSTRDRVICGAAAGLGERTGIDPTAIRLGFVALTLAAGLGTLLYLACVLLSVEPAPGLVSPRLAAPSARRAVAFGMVVLGVLVLCRQAGLWFGDALVWPTVFIAIGSAVIWTRTGEAERTRWAGLVDRLPAGSREAVRGAAPRLRLLFGGGLMLVGLASFVATSNDARRNPLAAAAATAFGVAVILGPWMWRQARQLGEERRRRVRSQERAEVAAHLHDSVLQTLAMIQRSEEPREMATLARSQERELRTWLYGGAKASDHALLSTAINDAAAEIERDERVRIEVVTVGDCRLGEPEQALVASAREAMLNAARHSGAPSMSVFAESEPSGVTVFVRDQGRGFDLAGVPPDRRGIADSIVGRMAAQGGNAEISSAPGTGTQIRLVLPRRSPA